MNVDLNRLGIHLKITNSEIDKPRVPIIIGTVPSHKPSSNEMYFSSPPK